MELSTEEPDRKRPRLEVEEQGENMSKLRVVLVLCGSMSPITNLHLRMFGKNVEHSACVKVLLIVSEYL